VLLEKLASAPYDAVTECAPTPKEEVAKVAIPPLTVPVPSMLAPSWKVTTPVGETEPEAGIVAVNVIS
jgi:hypothetical protein